MQMCYTISTVESCALKHTTKLPCALTMARRNPRPGRSRAVTPPGTPPLALAGEDLAPAGQPMCDSMKAYLERMEAGLEARIEARIEARFEARLAGAEARAERAEADLAAKEMEVDAQIVTIGALNQSLATKNAEAAQLQDEVQQLNDEVEQLNDEVEQLNDDLKNKNTELNGLKEELKAKEDELGQENEDLTQINNPVTVTVQPKENWDALCTFVGGVVGGVGGKLFLVKEATMLGWGWVQAGTIAKCAITAACASPVATVAVCAIVGALIGWGISAWLRSRR